MYFVIYINNNGNNTKHLALYFSFESLYELSVILIRTPIIELSSNHNYIVVMFLVLLPFHL